MTVASIALFPKAYKYTGELANTATLWGSGNEGFYFQFCVSGPVPGSPHPQSLFGAVIPTPWNRHISPAL